MPFNMSSKQVMAGDAAGASLDVRQPPALVRAVLIVGSSVLAWWGLFRIAAVVLG